MYYPIIVVIQILCVLHVIQYRKERWWIWLIVFIPVVGSIVYLFMEVLNRRDMNQLQSSLTQSLNPSSKIIKLEKQLAFADSHQNRIALADAYLEFGDMQKAIVLYEESLQGLYADDPYVNMQLVMAYFLTEAYPKAIEKAQTVLKDKDFQKSTARLYYALSLEKSHQKELAENELEALNVSYSNYEQRLAYGQFLIRNQQSQKAGEVFEEIIAEYNHLSPIERKKVKKWVNQAQDELKKIQS
jgi:hypothetical protein